MKTGGAKTFLVAAAVLRAAGSAGNAPPPQDPCSLLEPAEIQALAPTALIGPGVSSTMPDTLGSYACEYKWGSGDNLQTGLYQLRVIVNDASKAFPGTDPQALQEGLLLRAKNELNTSVIPGVGQAAVFASEDPIRASATAYLKGFLLEIQFQGLGARARRDQVIALLKAAAERL